MKRYVIVPESPAEPDDPIPVDDSNRRSRLWCFLFAANLIVPMMFAVGVCNTAYSASGLIIGIAFCAAFSLFIVHRFEFLGKALQKGAIVLTFLEFAGFVHMAAGMIAMGIWSRVSGVKALRLGDEPDQQFLGACFVTIQTGQILLMTALIIGTGLQLLFRQPNHESSASRLNS